MKITAVNAYPVLEARTFLFIEIETDEGVVGIGESGLTGHERAVLGGIETLKEVLIDSDPFRIEHLWQTMFRGRFFPAQRVMSAAIAAVDMALWDIKGKALGVPVYELLGGRVRDRVICYPHTSGDSPEDLAASAMENVADGWKFVRWDLPSRGDTIEPSVAVRDAIERFDAVRSAVGEDIEICADVHTRLDPSDAVTLCRELEKYRPYFIEDPLRAEDSNAYRRLRSVTGVPIAAGEHHSNKWEFRQLIEEDLIDFARIDLAICAGITEARKISGWCETHYIRLAVHNPIGPVSTAACLHLNLATPNFAVQELPRRPEESLPDLIEHQPLWENGYLLPPDRPGLGITLNRSALGRYIYEPKSLPNLRRADGSFTNW